MITARASAAKPRRSFNVGVVGNAFGMVGTVMLQP
jgi:hypothetical protein